MGQLNGVVHQGLLIAAAVIFIIAAVIQPPRINLTNVGLALLSLSFIL